MMFALINRANVNGLGNGGLHLMNSAQQQICNQRDSNLDAHGILAGAEDLPDLKRLLDPAEEQLDALCRLSMC